VDFNKVFCTVHMCVLYKNTVLLSGLLAQNVFVEKLKNSRLQRYFTLRFAGTRNVDYNSRLTIVGLHSRENRRVFDDLVLCDKILTGLLC